jgi:hypothetical protein
MNDFFDSFKKPVNKHDHKVRVVIRRTEPFSFLFCAVNN